MNLDVGSTLLFRVVSPTGKRLGWTWGEITRHEAFVLDVRFFSGTIREVDVDYLHTWRTLEIIVGTPTHAGAEDWPGSIAQSVRPGFR